MTNPSEQTMLELAGRLEAIVSSGQLPHHQTVLREFSLAASFLRAAAGSAAVREKLYRQHITKDRIWYEEVLPSTPEDASTAAGGWKDDPSADERWNAGLDFGMVQLCTVFGVDPHTVNWDAATETLDGDVCAAIGNILRTKYGDDFDPTAPVSTAAGEAVALDSASAGKASEAIFDYCDSNLTMMDACGMDTIKAQQLFDAAKILRNMFRGEYPAAVPAAQPDGVREALQPFAKIADEYDDRESDDFQIWKDCDQPQTRVTLGQCRNARVALSRPAPAGDGQE